MPVGVPPRRVLLAVPQRKEVNKTMESHCSVPWNWMLGLINLLFPTTGTC